MVITINADGSVTTTITNPNPYDGAEDTLVGIVNNSSSAITSLHLSSSTLDLFGFDGDGACNGSYVASGPCGGLFGSADPADYAGPNVTFSNIAADTMSGNVNFSGGIAAHGGTAWFSLEEPPSLSFVVTPGPIATTPEPATFVLLGTGLLFATGFRRLRK